MKVKNVDSWLKAEGGRQHSTGAKGASDGAGKRELRGVSGTSQLLGANALAKPFLLCSTRKSRFALLFALHIAIGLAINLLLAAETRKEKRGAEGVEEVEEKNIYIYI